MKISKYNTLFSSITLFGFGILFYIFTFGLALADSSNSAINLGFLGMASLHFPLFGNTAANVVFYMLLPVPGIFCFIRGIYDYRRALNTRKDEMQEYPKSIWSKLAVFTKYSDFISNLVFILIFLVLDVLCIYVLAKLRLRFTVFTCLYLLSVILCIAFCKKFLRSFKKATVKLRKGFPSYTLFLDSIEIRLYPIGKSKRSVNPTPVRLYFNELDEVKVLTDVEAENYMKYTVGPDISLSKKLVEGKTLYLKGEIKRPPVFRSATCTNSLSVLFRGIDIFYLITFENDIVKEIEAAFTAYKKIHM